MNQCVIDDCTNKIITNRGLCRKHFVRRTNEERFWENVIKQDDGCWLWNGYIDINGYGSISFNNKRIATHRYSFKLHNGYLPVGLELDHLCRNRACCNPEHLEPVTHRENLIRGAVILNKNEGLPPGVTKKTFKHSIKYQVRKVFNGVRVYLGLYNNPEDASVVYQTAICTGDYYSCLKEIK